MKVTLPYPPRVLSPNARQHWAEIARKKREYRNACAWQAVAQGLRRMDAQGLQVSFVFYPPNRQRRDLDNAIASIKAGIDGLVDVLGVDDSKWAMDFRLADEIGGKVDVTIEAKHG